MKLLYIFIATIFIETNSFGQIELISNKQDIRIACTGNLTSTTYYIIKSDNRKVEFLGGKNDFRYNALASIKPSWIKTISIFKGDAAVRNFGKVGHDGVVILEIKRNKIRKLPRPIKNELLKKDN